MKIPEAGVNGGEVAELRFAEFDAVFRTAGLGTATLGTAVPAVAAPKPPAANAG